MAHNQVEHLAQRKHFATYWSIEAVNLALEVCLLPNVLFHGYPHNGWICNKRFKPYQYFYLQKGDVFKAMFRVNAHNRVEVF